MYLLLNRFSSYRFGEKSGAWKLICQDPFDQVINYTAGLLPGVCWESEVGKGDGWQKVRASDATSEASREG